MTSACLSERNSESIVSEAAPALRRRPGSPRGWGAAFVFALGLGLLSAPPASWAGDLKNKEEAEASVTLLKHSDLPPVDRTLPDGFYLVLRSSNNPDDLGAVADSQRLVFQGPQYLPRDAKGASVFLVIPDQPSARLSLSSPARWVADSETPHLLLPLSAATLKELERLSQSQGGKMMALVVGGEVVNTRPIAATPPDAAYQADCAKRRACQHVLQLLQDNVASSGE